MDSMNQQQLMTHGRRLMNETDSRLDRTLQTVNNTIEVGTLTVKQLEEQTQKMEEVINNLDEMKSGIKEARRYLKDMTKQMATDKCILGFLLLVVAGIVTIIVLKVMHVKILKNVNISIPLPQSSPPPAPSPGRRLLAGGLRLGGVEAWALHAAAPRAGEHTGGSEQLRWLR